MNWTVGLQGKQKQEKLFEEKKNHWRAVYFSGYKLEF